MAAVDAIPPRKVLGEGSFGIVVGPALPNWNDAQQLVEYPQNVTKIFRTSRNRNKAIANSRRLQRTVRQLEATAERYRRPYRLRNLNANIRERVRNYLGPGTHDNRVLSLLRAPYLGQSIYHIDRTQAAYRAVRQIPYQVLCAQMLKCMEVVQAIHAAGYIHGDIRETNVLCHLETGALTIIDFDWLKPFDVFYSEYPTFFYSHPPEALFIWGRDGVGIQNLMGDYWDNQRVYQSVHTDGYDIFKVDDAADAATYFSMHFVPNPQPRPQDPIPWELYRRGLFDIAKNFIDSYGLAHSFKGLVEKAWYIHFLADGSLQDSGRGAVSLGHGAAAQTEEEYQRFLLVRRYLVTVLLPRMLSSNYMERWDIGTAIEKFKMALRHFGVRIEDWLAADQVAAQATAVEAELAFMQEFADFHLAEPGAIPSPIPPGGAPPVAEVQAALGAVMEEAQLSMPSGGKRLSRRHRVRKTVKNARSTR